MAKKQSSKQREAKVRKAVAPSDPRQEKVRETEEFLNLARTRFRLAAEAESQNRRDSLDDLKFSIGEQWPADIETQRTADGRPCLKMNRLPQFIRQVTNEQRQQRPAIQVSPVGSGSDKETAEVLEGMVRHIETISDAEVAYDTGFDSAVRTGLGFWRLVTEFIDDTESFDQEIKIKRIKNRFTVYFDPSAVEADYSDARYAFVVEDLPGEVYKQRYGDSAAASLVDFASVGDTAPGWAGRDESGQPFIRVAEYWYVTEKKRELLQLEDGRVMDRAEYKKAFSEDAGYLTDQDNGAITHGITGEAAPAIVGTRSRLDRSVSMSMINAIEELEKHEWAGRWIPLIPVIAEDIDVDGQRHLAGLVRDAKDPQRMYNYWVSAATERIALAPKAPFIAAEGQIENHESEWAQANVRNFPVLQYKPVSLSGQPVPPPQRQQLDSQMTDFSRMIAQADNDLKSTTGIYDASLGQKGPDESGKAILLRQHQTDISTLNYSDNMSRAIRATGRQLLDLIPHIYDAPRVQRIIKPDQTVDQVGIFNSKSAGMSADEVQQLAEMQGIKKIYDIGVGRYNVTVNVGPSYQTKRQESAASMLQLVQSYPNLIPLAGDLIVRNMDWAGADAIADRLKKMLPPQLQEGDQSDPEVQNNMLRSQLQQVSQQHALMTQALQNALETIRTKKIEQDGKIAATKIDADAKISVAEIQTRAQSASERKRWLLDLWKELHSAAHEAGLAATQPTQPSPMAGGGAAAPSAPDAGAQPGVTQ